jgi:hypothetical protein
MKLLCYVFALEDAGANNKDPGPLQSNAWGVRVCLASIGGGTEKKSAQD